MTLILLFFTCLRVYGASASDYGASDSDAQAFWWSDSQTLIDDCGIDLQACFYAGIDGQTYDDGCDPEKLQQFVKPIIDIVQRAPSQSWPDILGWSDIREMASNCAKISDAFDRIKGACHQKSMIDPDNYSSVFFHFWLCVEQCCNKNKSQAIIEHFHFMDALKKHDFKYILEAYFDAEIDGQTYDDDCDPEKLQQFVKPIIDIVQRAPSYCPDILVWSDIRKMASSCAQISDDFDWIKGDCHKNSMRYLDNYSSVFKNFLLYVKHSCKQNHSQASRASLALMAALKKNALKRTCDKK
ncbi:MAG: hypothetical protein OXC30_05080 [Alphaproteobacteria bacterium]|nr:hypothetical protein [Alphaproteobacteria bacterium]